MEAPLTMEMKRWQCLCLFAFQLIALAVREP
jgi:hypothetical protein